MRYEYNLTPDSVVIDAGGYEGNFAKMIADKYGCKVFVFEPVSRFAEIIEKKLSHYQNIDVFRFGIGAVTGPKKFHVQNDSTGEFAGSTDTEIVQLFSIDEIDDALGFPLFEDDVSLFKLNVEGNEFCILERALETGLVTHWRNIQVQFHPIVPDYEARYQRIREGLLKTHEFTFDEPWIWQNFELRK